MRVLVTGSHGFVGSQLVKALKERGDEVYICDPKTGSSVLHDHFMWIPRCDEIYHLACVNQEEAVEDSERNVLVNAYGAQRMSYLAQKWKARLVYTSTASVYGNPWTIGGFPTPVKYETSPKSDYAVAKLAGEHFVRNSGADFTIFRLSNVYGPGQTTENPYCGVVAKFLEAARAGEPLKIIGDGSQTRDFTYVEDILPHLMNPELKGTLNASHGKEVSVKALALLIAMMEGPFLKTKSAPERPVDGIQRRCLLSDVDCPTGLPEGLQRTLAWMDNLEYVYEKAEALTNRD